LSLYNDTTFEGHELYFEGDALQLLEPFDATSYCFTGIDRWELYEGEQFNGESKCLQIREEISYDYPKCENGLGVTDSFKNVRSIVRGCHHEEGNNDVHPPSEFQCLCSFKVLVVQFTSNGTNVPYWHRRA